MSRFIPPRVPARALENYLLVIDLEKPYYSNFIKKLVACGYILFGKGMVVYAEEKERQYKIDKKIDKLHE